MKNQKALYSPTLASLPESLPAHRRPPAQQEPDVPRAYRLGKCETLYDLYSLLVNERCTAKDLQREIVVRLVRRPTPPERRAHQKRNRP